MLIIFPHIAILQLLKKALTGEIANKLGVAPEEVEDILAGEKSKPKTEILS